jgi:hypothetical protein
MSSLIGLPVPAVNRVPAFTWLSQSSWWGVGAISVQFGLVQAVGELDIEEGGIDPTRRLDAGRYDCVWSLRPLKTSSGVPFLRPRQAHAIPAAYLLGADAVLADGPLLITFDLAVYRWTKVNFQILCLTVLAGNLKYPCMSSSRPYWTPL